MTANGLQPDARFGGKYAGVKVLVLGASGFIGNWTLRALSAEGATTHAVIRDPAAAARCHLPFSEVIVEDLAPPGAVAAIVKRVRPSIVFNLAGYGVDHAERDPALMVALNARMVAELCEALAATPAPAWSGLRLVHVGSALEYGRVPGPLREDVTPNPTTDYGRTKLLGTEHVARAGRATGLRSIVVRLFTVYGPGEHSGRLLPSLLEAAHAGDRVRLSGGTQERDFTYVEDAVEGLLRLGLTEAAAGMVVNLATGELTAVRSFAEAATSVLDLGAEQLEFGALPVQSGKMFHDQVDVTRLERLLAWRPRVSIAEGVRRTRECQRVQ